MTGFWHVVASSIHRVPDITLGRIVHITPAYELQACDSKANA
ncbi:MAG: hypothetical protein Q8O55_01290 [Dehalococcoidales bacterium]|nr:hypothetical protein [Dehalococcoidales bacterium]MDZ4245672.1 hypothetical protein [Dehalococcoidia bacterium]